MTTTDGKGTVVVGVDGSPESAAALAYALDDAARRGAGLRVVAAVRIPEYWDTAYRQGAPPPPPEFVQADRESAQRTIDEVVAAAGQRAAGVPLTLDVVTGVPSAVLGEASRDADHLVLGHRRRGRIASAVLGSVGLECVLNATCPVTIVPLEALHPHTPGPRPSDADAALRPEP